MLDHCTIPQSNWKVFLASWTSHKETLQATTSDEHQTKHCSSSKEHLNKREINSGFISSFSHEAVVFAISTLPSRLPRNISTVITAPILDRDWVGITYYHAVSTPQSWLKFFSFKLSWMRRSRELRLQAACYFLALAQFLSIMLWSVGLYPFA